MSKLWEVACRNICVSDDIGMGRSSQVEARIKVVGEASFPFSPNLLLFRIWAVVPDHLGRSSEALTARGST